MNRYELATYVVESLTSDRDLTDTIVERLVAEGVIESAAPGDLVPGGLSEEHGLTHKAAPMSGDTINPDATCRHCGLRIMLVPQYQGAAFAMPDTWVHSATRVAGGEGGPIVIGHGGRPGKQILVKSEGVCGLNPDIDSHACPNASLYRRRQGCGGFACKDASATYYKQNRK